MTATSLRLPSTQAPVSSFAARGSKTGTLPSGNVPPFASAFSASGLVLFGYARSRPAPRRCCASPAPMCASWRSDEPSVSSICFAHR